MSRPRVAIDESAHVVHYEDRPTARRGGGAGGTTLCGLRFVPRTSYWTRDGRRVAGCRSCPRCLAIVVQRNA